MTPRLATAAAGDPVIAEHAQLLAERSRALWARGLTVATCGNASVRLDSGEIVIKATGVCMGEMTPADSVVVTLDGRVISGERDPSREIAWHLGIYRERPDVGAIVHAHPPHATAWAMNNLVPPSMHVAARDLLGPVALVDLAPPGSAQLATLVTAAFRSADVRAALLREHGVVIAAPTLHGAVHLTDLLEDTATVALLAALVPGAAAQSSGVSG